MSTLRCHTTILFADLSSSTRIGESLDPEQLAELLARLRKVAEDVIARHGGVVNQFYGDGVLAAFGFIEPREDDVLHAINAALDLHEEAAAILPIPGIDIPDFTLKLHSGIHAGLVFVQDGDRIQGRYKLTGDALNTAARLSDAADSGELLVSGDTIRSLLPYFETEPVEALDLKGKRNPLQAYRVLGRTSVRTRFQASVRRGLSNFIGRQQEISLLFKEFSRSGASGCRYFELCGDPGVGKTRLSEEFLTRTAHDIVIFKAYCESGDSGRPLHPFLQIMRSVFELKSNMPNQDLIDHFSDLMRSRFETLVRYESDFLRLLGLSNSAGKIADGSVLAQRSIHAVSALIEHLAKDRQVILYLDDWHLADDLSAKTLFHLMQELSQYPLFIILATRSPSEEIKAFSGLSLPLSPLSLEESTLLATRFFQQQMLERYADLLHQQSGGNPLFIEELCQSFSVSEQPHLAGDSIGSVPVTLSGLIATRMNRLPDELRQLVKIAAVLGTTFENWLFEAMLNTPLSEDHLQKLAKYDVIYLGGTQGTLRFKHGITREVVYEKIRLQERRELHIRASAILEQHVMSSGSEAYYELLAYHFQGAQNQPKTGYYAELAGDRAMATMALDRAGAQYQRALRALDPTTCPGSSYQHWKSVLLKFGWVSVFDPLQDYLEAFERGVDLAKMHEDYEGMAKTQHWLGYLHYALGNSAPAIRYCEQAIATAEQLQAWPLRVETTALLGQAKGAAMEYQDAVVLLDLALEAKNQHNKRDRPSVGSAYSLACKGAVLGDQGRFDDAYECFELALDSLGGVDHQLEGSVRGLYSCVSLWQGRWQAGKEHAERAYQVARRISSAYMSTMYQSLACFADWKMHGSKSALGIIESATLGLEQRHRRLFLSLNYGWLAQMLVANGTWQARQYAARALMRARQQDRMGEAMAYRALAELAEQQRAGSGQRYMERACRSAKIRNSRHEAANNQLQWGTIYYHRQRYSQASRHLELALQEYRALDMHWHEQQASVLLQHCTTPPNCADRVIYQ